MIDSLHRRLATIGEATWQLNKLDNTLELTNKNKIIGLRHKLIHEYDLIDDATIWKICKKYLPILKREIELLLN